MIHSVNNFSKTFRVEICEKTVIMISSVTDYNCSAITIEWCILQRNYLSFICGCDPDKNTTQTVELEPI